MQLLDCGVFSIYINNITANVLFHTSTQTPTQMEHVPFRIKIRVYLEIVIAEFCNRCGKYLQAYSVHVFRLQRWVLFEW